MQKRYALNVRMKFHGNLCIHYLLYFTGLVQRGLVFFLLSSGHVGLVCVKVWRSESLSQCNFIGF